MYSQCERQRIRELELLASGYPLTAAIAVARNEYPVYV